MQKYYIQLCFGKFIILQRIERYLTPKLGTPLSRIIPANNLVVAREV